jgi:acetyl-CoA carboxylase carboxyl transferase subunit beta
MTEWFRRKSKNIKTSYKKDTQEGSWLKCPQCDEVLYKNLLEKNFSVCNNCSYHFRMNFSNYIKLLIDDNKYIEFASKVTSYDSFNFYSKKKYSDQLKEYIDKTGENSAVKTIEGKINNSDVILAVMNFKFIGGSMGSVVGHKIGLAIDRAYKKKIPLIIVTASGGARMQEGVLSLMQLAKTSTKLARFSESGGLYITVLTDPTTGGISASFGMLGDVIYAEPKALVGFAGPRVIKQTIGQDLPQGFQKSEFLFEKGFIDRIVERKELKNTIARTIKLLH